MGPSFHPRIQTTVLTMGASWLTPPKQVNTVPSAGKVIAFGFLGC